MLKGVSREVLVRGAVTYAFIALWITLSSVVIIFNKYILAYTAMKYPILLTICHMLFASCVSSILVATRVVQPINMDWSTYKAAIVPIALLFSLVLWLGNAAYEYLSVSFIQMLKAQMSVWVYSVAVAFKLEKFLPKTMGIMLVIAIGIITASVGELLWNTVGVLYQMASIVFEAIRLNLVQILIQRRGLKLNPVTTLYYLAPASFVFLCVPFVFIEYPVMKNDPHFTFDTSLMLLNCLAAYGLNLSVFMLIGRTSALTMNVAGVVKDWLLIGLSALIYRNPVTRLNLIGYSIAFAAVAYYNQIKIAAQLAASKQNPQPESAGKEKTGA